MNRTAWEWCEEEYHEYRAKCLMRVEKKISLEELKKCQRNKKGREQNMSKEEREIRMIERKTVRKISGRYTIK